MKIGIWYKYENKKPEKVDEASNIKEASYLYGEYALAFGLLPRQHRHGKDKLWIGLMRDEPKEI